MPRFVPEHIPARVFPSLKNGTHGGRVETFDGHAAFRKEIDGVGVRGVRVGADADSLVVVEKRLHQRTVHIDLHGDLPVCIGQWAVYRAGFGPLALILCASLDCLPGHIIGVSSGIPLTALF